MYNEQNVIFKDKEDFGTLCVCALRYCHGRQTYMPSLVIEIVSQNLDLLSDKNIKVMLDDCEFQRNANLYGDEYIDKPLWIEWKETLENEMKRRKNEEPKEKKGAPILTKEEILLANRMLP